MLFVSGMCREDLLAHQIFCVKSAFRDRFSFNAYGDVRSIAAMPPGAMGPESERSLLNKARELRFLEGSFHKTHAIKNLSSVS